MTGTFISSLFIKIISFSMTLSLLFLILYILNLLIKSERLSKLLRVRYLIYIISVMIIGNVVGYGMAYIERSSSIETSGFWSKSMEKQVYDKLYETGESFGLAASEKAQLANCGLGKFKTMFPNGLGSLSNDTLKKITNTLVDECLPKYGETIFRWTEKSEDVLKQKLNNELLVNQLPESERVILIECVIQKLKDRYPEGMKQQITEDIWSEILVECYK